MPDQRTPTRRHAAAHSEAHGHHKRGIRRHGTARRNPRERSRRRKPATKVSSAITAGLILGVLISVVLYATGRFPMEALAGSADSDQPESSQSWRVSSNRESDVRSDADTVFPGDVEVWRSTVATACEDVGLDVKWTDTVLAMMQAESGGDLDVSSVVGCRHDVMQAGEGCAGVYAGSQDVVKLGSDALLSWGLSPSVSFGGNTATASIYAGVLETKQNVDLLEDWLGDVDVGDLGKVGLVAQGYNYGADGWFAYCRHYGIVSWDYDASQSYKWNHGGGTADHGQKVMNFYEEAKDRKAGGETADDEGE